MTFKLHCLKNKLLVGCVKLCSCSLVIPVWQTQPLLWHFSVEDEGHQPSFSPPHLAAQLQPASLQGSAFPIQFWTAGHYIHSAKGH